MQLAKEKGPHPLTLGCSCIACVNKHKRRLSGPGGILLSKALGVLTQPFSQIRLFKLPPGAFQKHNDPVSRRSRQSIPV